MAAQEITLTVTDWQGLFDMFKSKQGFPLDDNEQPIYTEQQFVALCINKELLSALKDWEVLQLKKKQELSERVVVSLKE